MYVLNKIRLTLQWFKIHMHPSNHTCTHTRARPFLRSQTDLVSLPGKNLTSPPKPCDFQPRPFQLLPFPLFFITWDGPSASMTKRTRLRVWQGDPVGQEEILRPGERIWPARYYDKSPSRWEFACNILQCRAAALCPGMISATSSIISSGKWHLVLGRAAPARKQAAAEALERRGFERMQI